MGRKRGHGTYVTTGGGSAIPSVRDISAFVSGPATATLPWPNTTPEVNGTPAIIIQTCRGNDTNNLPTGGPTWTLFREFAPGTSSLYRELAVYYAYATGTGMADVTCTCTGANIVGACMITFDDTLSAGNFLEFIREEDSGANTAVSFTDANTAGPNRLVIDILTAVIDAATDPTVVDMSNSVLDTYTKYLDAGSAQGAGASLSVSAGGLATTGAVGVTTATLAASARHEKMTIAVVPVP